MDTYLLQVTANGDITRIPFDPANSYNQLSDAVGGYIELVPTGRDIDLFCNEEGKLTGLPFNMVLTGYYRKCRPTADSIVGNGVFCKSDAEGETLGLTKWECVDLENELGRIKSQV